jgi:hypothetical protein
VVPKREGGLALVLAFPATDAEVGFLDLSRGNDRLGPASPFKNAATDGKDPGAAIDALEAATAGVLCGDWK